MFYSEMFKQILIPNLNLPTSTSKVTHINILWICYLVRI